jgi:hypothetical protein
MTSTGGRFRTRTAWIHAASAVAKDRAITGARKVLGLSSYTRNVLRKRGRHTTQDDSNAIRTPISRRLWATCYARTESDADRTESEDSEHRSMEGALHS